MFKALPKLIIGLLFSINCFGTANSVYHEFTMNTVGGGCGNFVSKTAPINTDAVTIEFTIDYQSFTNRARIYYTTDGSTPAGAFGVPSGSTQVVTASYFCSFNNGTGMVDVAQGVIPALPVGTVVKYIVSAWHSSGGLEIFAVGGSNTSSAAATLFTYTVSSALPISLLNFSGKKENSNIKLFWSTAQEINTNRYEIYASANGVDFKNIGTQKAAGNSSNVIDYSFTDANPVNGNNFYKLKIIDKDEHFSYSKVILFSYTDNNASSIIVWDNILHVRLSSSQKGNYSVTMINNLGQAIKTWNIVNNISSAEYNFDLPGGIAKNVYHFTLKGNATANSRSFFIQ